MEEKIKNLCKNFAKNLKTERLAAGMTQKVFAQKIGITTQSYQAYEIGLTMPTAENLLKICIILQVSIDYLFNYNLN